MTEYEKVEKLREKANVSYEEAKAALEASDWDLLDAIVLLEKEGRMESGAARHSTQAQAPAEDPAAEDGGRFKAHASGVWAQIKRLIQIGNENNFVISRKDDPVLSLPVTVMVLLLLLINVWLFVALVVGLFCGLRYSIHGEQLGKPEVNEVMDKAANAAENVRETVEDSLRSGK